MHAMTLEAHPAAVRKSNVMLMPAPPPPAESSRPFSFLTPVCDAVLPGLSGKRPPRNMCPLYGTRTIPIRPPGGPTAFEDRGNMAPSLPKGWTVPVR